MLKHVLLTMLLCSASAAAADEDRIKVPERLTIGAADQFLGTLSPDGKRLFFVSTIGSTLQIYAQELAGGVAAPLFDEAADCTAPHVSPDGKRLAYLSYRADATGDVCVRDLATLEKKCVTGADTAEQDLLWAARSDALLVVSRAGLHDTVQLDRISLGGSKQPVFSRDLSSPALSPDGQWLAYVPTERDSTAVGASFAARAVRAIALQRLDRPSDAPLRVSFDLPGETGFPAFSADGKWLYFAQYLDDSNHDGVIDAHDRSALFRVAFDGAKPEPIGTRERANPFQLTNVEWNCQYPAPGPSASHRLVATCSVAGSLDVYSLPLEGAVPPSWNTARLTDELATATGRGERMLLAARLIAAGLSPEAEASVLQEVLRVHLDDGALDSAAWALARLKTTGRLSADVVTLLTELIDHRRAERALDHGQLSASFVVDARARLSRVEQIPKAGEAGSFRALLRAELLDVLADKQAALAALHEVDLARATSALLVYLTADRALDLYAQLDDRASLLEVLRACAEHPQLNERRRLGFADRYITNLLHGTARTERAALLEDAARRVPAGGELGTRIALERALLELQPGADEAALERVRKGTLELYERTKSFERRRNIVHATVARANAAAADDVLRDLSKAWVSYVPEASAEHRYAQKVHRDVVLERAYVALRERSPVEARDRFRRVTRHGDSLEAWTGFLELRAAESPRDASSELETQFAGKPNDPVLAYGRAYLAVRSLETTVDRRVVKIDEALAHLRSAARSLARSYEVNYLWGYCLYQRYLATGNRDQAEEGNTKLLLALDLAADEPRYRASILETLARLQTTVGNHRIALGYYVERAKLPFTTPIAELGHLVSQARSQQQVDDGKGAITTIEHALALADHDPRLAAFVPLVLDRAALHYLAAGNGAAALAHYDRLAKLPPVTSLSTNEQERDRYTTHLGRGAAALLADRPRDAALDLAQASDLLDHDPGLAQPLRRPTDLPPDRDALRTNRVLVAGMRAESYERLGELEEAIRRETRRRDLLVARYETVASDEDLVAIAETEAHLGRYAVALHRRDDARLHYEAALRSVTRFCDKVGSVLHPLRADILSDLVRLRLAETKPRAGALDLGAELTRLLDALARTPNPDWEDARNRLTADLALMRL